uniref:Phosphoinositide phospholipase C n=1 Tax=Denticeps clupeoides TaxID=299321 RepID=A0AAY4EZ40_9TELE
MQRTDNIQARQDIWTDDGTLVARCMCTMQGGTEMIKLRGKSKTLLRYFYLDEHRSCIRWRPSRKRERAKISIDSIHEVCEGKKTEAFQHFVNSNLDPNCCFSIYHGYRVESLDLVTSTAEEARTWITGLKYLMAGISDEDSLAKRQRTRDQYPLSCSTGGGHPRSGTSVFYFEMNFLNFSCMWLKQTFSEADKNGDGNLSISEVLQLLHKLNVNLSRQKVQEMFTEADTDENEGSLAFDEFCSFYKMMSTRRDLYLIMLSYSSEKDYMDVKDLLRFLEVEQKMTGVTKEQCQEIIKLFEPNPQNAAHMVFGIDGFTSYMRSPAGDVFNPAHYEVNQDMTQPLCNYFIASSHNTYLTGDQLLSQSRVDMYAYVLKAGCRCVEVDCWDGPDGEPIVHHGYTLTSKILFRDIVESINKYAFVKSQYPVILSIENHCTVPQQKKMAQYLIEVLQDKLDLSTVNANETTRRLPCPEVLKGKILVKGKKLPANIDADADEGDVSDEDSGEEDEEDEEEPKLNGEVKAEKPQLHVQGLHVSLDVKHFGKSFTPDALPNAFFHILQKKKRGKVKKKPILEDSDTDPEPSKMRKTMRLSRALSDLVKYTKSVHVHDIETQAYMCSWQVSSLNETITNQILQMKPAQLVRFNQRQLLRVYPSNYRVDSSNFNPQPFWNAGCHLVALNYQTEDRMLQLNRAKFATNGNCGYLLKPKCMCKGAFNPTLDDPLSGHKKKQLVLKIISGQQLPKPKDSILGDRGEIIDPLVEVEIVGLPADCDKKQTRVVYDNGFNPMWEETLVFMVHLPQIALVRFMVWDHNPIGRDFIGQRTIAFMSMLPGYRHVYLEGMEEASVFVHIAVSDISGKHKEELSLSVKKRHPALPKKDVLEYVEGSRLLKQDTTTLVPLERLPQSKVYTLNVGSLKQTPHPYQTVEIPKAGLTNPKGVLRTEQGTQTDPAERAPGPVGSPVRSKSVPRRHPPSPGSPFPSTRTHVNWQNPVCQNDGGYGTNPGHLPNSESSNDSLESLDLESLPSRVPVHRHQDTGTLQREMNALFEQKIREIRCKSPLFFSGKFCVALKDYGDVCAFELEMRIEFLVIFQKVNLQLYLLVGTLTDRDSNWQPSDYGAASLTARPPVPLVT